ncbi:hypothetical protein BOTBODRAFT_121816 [Botryobasidium botryosum FD-172 SS1]|uniref:Band 7 domain-containing protein n=1 Tax=Botryobasidium botryosum (strain FD-172 SS1) TaxID=930990 RepID=A0A067M3Q6_BOTB1|nr:hypothetical protein BOTBODRAFT_121816 [Botryobasidium botryosum FD-172 SS1]
MSLARASRHLLRSQALGRPSVVLGATAPATARTFFTVIQQGHEAWRLTLGKNATKLNPGLHLYVPFIHSVQVVDIRETSVNITDLIGFTSDNVPVSVSGSLFFRIRDSYHACFSVHDVHSNVEKIGTSAMRSVIGHFAYDEIIGDRNKTNTKLHEVIGSTIEKWGVDCTRFEIQTFKPSNREVERQLELQMEAERNRRKQLLDTQAQINVAEGQKQRTILESEGSLQAQLNEAAGKKQQTILESEGLLEATQNEGRALAMQVEILAASLAPGGASGEVLESHRAKALDTLVELKRIGELQAIARGGGNSTYFFGSGGGKGAGAGAGAGEGEGEVKKLAQDPFYVDNMQRWKKDVGPQQGMP